MPASLSAGAPAQTPVEPKPMSQRWPARQLSSLTQPLSQTENIDDSQYCPGEHVTSPQRV